ncbi:IKI3 family-domain-containing protein [Cokeromyces recurvatus]|uniref:IKI3 family-domain-containing protein n=1 Tax=Cokeromyces recurvatus TaxID=90255 RepID=UPI00221F1873|nr:IKI3 family-domain-containing protein [Cokeromyces recurvatus]KAI7903384.1 IKI3 family-domain-containing protein [Cokeromyces recurvatus]
MRSLELLGQRTAKVTSSTIDGRSFIAFDPESSTVYAAFVDLNDQIRVAANNLAPNDPNAFVEIDRCPGSNIVNFTFIADQQVACLCTWSGDIIHFSKERFEKGEEAMEIIGSVDAGIHAMCWSPDQDLLVLVTGDKKIVEMTQDFDTITEFYFHVEDQGEGVQHSVGWGRKETQFHGSEGKQAAQQKIDTSKFVTSNDDDSKPRVAWRGDGSFFVVSDVDPNRSARVIRIYNREGVLQNTSEPVDKLEHVLDWRPSGNLIVSSQRLPHRHDIVFFERNGLRHGEFSLRETQDMKQKVLEVMWNADSTVLAIWIESVINGKLQKTVQLWTSKNYHWYMKQHIVLSEERDIIGFAWDVENALIAHLFTSDGEYHRLLYTLDVYTSTSIDEANSGYVAVIDGSQLLLTPFAYMNVPPPMSSLAVNAHDNIQYVAFSPHLNGLKVAVLTNQKIQLFDLPEKGVGNASLTDEYILPEITAENESYARNHIRQLCWVNETQLVYCQYDDSLQADMICIAKFNNKNMTITAHPFDGSVGRIYFNVNTKDLIAERLDGFVFNIALDDEQATISQIEQFPDFCPWIATARIGISSKEYAVIGLTDRSKLYINDNLISSEATSFYLRGAWLVFSTTRHTARFLSLDSSSINDLSLPDDTNDAYDETSRRLERGSKIVIATQHKPNLVLQMPRGNLETISPRAFVLAAIREDLKNLNFRSAFIACRRNRIDLNILYDDNPERFIEHIRTFIEQVSEVDYLNLFLSNLRNEDTLVTMYRRGGRTADQLTAAPGVENKVNTVCEAVRKILIELGQERYMQSILSTYVRSSPPDLESAMTLLSELRETNHTAAEDALKYTIFLCKADLLYNVALGMYNFPLTLMVAQQAQMDPKEYLPFLQELKNFEKYYQRYKIDDHLKRYERAIKNLSLAGDEHFDELLDYMQKHSLYHIAIEEYANKRQQRIAILEVYGAHLDFTTQYEEAGIVFVMAGNLVKALESYRMAGCWREAFSISNQLNYTQEETHALAYSMIEYLKDKRRYQEAAAVAKDYANDVEEAVDCLLKGSLWKEAERVSYSSGRSDLIETHVKPGLVEGYTQMDDDIDEMMTQFHKQSTRLVELRTHKPEPTQVNPMANDETLDNIDMFSDTTSMYSQFTRYTSASSRVSTMSSSTQGSARSRKTSKLRKREERKRARGKRGTVFEEEYIVNSIKKLIEKACSMQNELGSLIRALVPFEYVEEARAIQEKFDKFFKELEGCMNTVFVPLKLAVSLYATLEEFEEAKNNPKVIEKPVINKVDWKLKLL